MSIKSFNEQIETQKARANTQKDVLDVLIIGAGLSGICAGIKLLEKNIQNFCIYEKSDGIGGTWHDNTYPGAACDVPSHLYSYSFELNPDWSHVYSGQAEIKDYVKNCADKYGVTDYIENGKKVLELRFDDLNGIWAAYLEDGNIVYAHHIINGMGGLHEPLVPEFEGRDDFAGKIVHTARWDKNIDLKEKKIAVIGSAASAIQAIPEFAKIASGIVIFQRTPNYIAPRNDRAYSQKWKDRFKRWPWLMKLYRSFIFHRMEFLLFPAIKKNSRWGKILGTYVLKYKDSIIVDSELKKKMKPDYKLGCKRILVSDNFFQTLNKKNVGLVTSGIKKLTHTGIEDMAGVHHECDVIVLATGYDIEKHMFSIQVYGENGRALHDDWADIPTAYNGLCVSGFPNFYMMTGPNTGVGTTSVIFMIEQQIDVILRLIEAAGDKKTISVKPEKQIDYNRQIQNDLGGTVWASGCSSWYRREDGVITTLYPSNARDYRKQQKNIPLSDFEIKAAGE